MDGGGSSTVDFQIGSFLCSRYDFTLSQCARLSHVFSCIVEHSTMSGLNTATTLVYLIIHVEQIHRTLTPLLRRLKYYSDAPSPPS